MLSVCEPLPWIFCSRNVTSYFSTSPNLFPICEPLPPLDTAITILYTTNVNSLFQKSLTIEKYAIFQNWLDTRLKMEMHEPGVYSTIFGGASRGFWIPFLDLGARSPIFFT